MKQYNEEVFYPINDPNGEWGEWKHIRHEIKK